MAPKKETSFLGRKAFKYRGTKCLNCEQPLDKSDIYCPYCSQLNSNKQLSAKDFFGEFLNSIVVIDSRLRNTFKDLLFRPGIITKNYAKGQRLKYANPFRFFLSVSIIYFLVSGLIDTVTSSTNRDLNLNATGLDSIGKNISISTQEALRIVDSVKALQPEKPLDYLSESQLDSMSTLKSYTERFSLYNSFYEKHKIKNAETALDSLHHKKSAFNKWVYSKNTTIDKIKDNPSTFINFIITKIPFFLFFFTPFFALFFWIIYSKRKYTYIEHMVFIFHIFSFIFLAMLLFLIPDLLIGSEILVGLLFLLIGPLYFYKALRNFYEQSRVITLIKFVFLNTVFAIGLSFALLLFIAASAAVY